MSEKKDKCSTCNGEKEVYHPDNKYGYAGTIKDKCPTCKGTGMGQFDHNKNAHCDTCKGTGKKIIKVKWNREKFITLLEDTELIPDKNLVVDKFLALIPDIEEVKKQYERAIVTQNVFHNQRIEEARKQERERIVTWGIEVCPHWSGKQTREVGVIKRDCSLCWQALRKE